MHLSLPAASQYHAFAPRPLDDAVVAELARVLPLQEEARAVAEAKKARAAAEAKEEVQRSTGPGLPG